MEKQQPIMKEWKDRKGVFIVPNDLLLTMGKKESSQLFEGLIIVRAESLFMPEAIEYHAYSEYFDKIPVGSVCPRYALELTQHKGKDGKTCRTTKKWRKVGYA